MFVPIFAASLSLLGTSLAAQGGLFSSPLSPFVRDLNLEPGKGAIYEVGSGQRGQRLTVAVVSRDTYQGSEGFWAETSSTRRGQTVIMKEFVAGDLGKAENVKARIMQREGQPPVQMPLEMMRQPSRARPNITERFTDRGTETIQVPAGEIQAQHFSHQDPDGSGIHLWVSKEVAPLGIVRLEARDLSVTLLEKIENYQSKVTGAPISSRK